MAAVTLRQHVVLSAPTSVIERMVSSVKFSFFFFLFLYSSSSKREGTIVVDMQMAGEMFDLFNLRVYRRSIIFARVFLRKEIMRSHRILVRNQYSECRKLFSYFVLLSER